MRKIDFRLAWISSMLLIILHSYPSCAQNQGIPSSPDKAWHLVGDELLLEISDPRGIQPNGVYALAPSQATQKDANGSTLKLLIKNASRPLWSPHHKRFVYLFNGQLWIGDLDGHKVAISDVPPPDPTSNAEGIVRWTLNGTLLYSRYSAAWGNQTLLGLPVEDLPLRDIQQSEDELFQNRFFMLLPLEHKELQGLSSSKLKWRDILSANEASFSPDGRQLAVELYPSSAFGLGRSASHIQIYDLFRLGSDAKVNDAIISNNRGWFGGSLGYVSASGPGSRLTMLENRKGTELMPRWSPTGQWIAFTSVDTANEWVLPIVVRPDGKDFNILVASDGENPIIEWTPIVKRNFTVGTLSPKSTKVWGDIQRIPIGWSSDGKYLWMISGNDTIWVAKREKDQWLTRSIPFVVTSEFGIAAWAYRDSRVAYVQDSGDVRKISKLTIMDIETNDSLSMSLRSSIQVKSISW